MNRHTVVIVLRLLAATVFLALAAREFMEFKLLVDPASTQLPLRRLKDRVSQDRYNPDAWYMLGCVYAFDPTNESMENARDCLMKAVHYNPYYFKYWMELAQVHDFLGNRHLAVRCMETAVQLNCSLSDLYWYAGNFFLKVGNPAESARCLRRALEGNAALCLPILEIASRMYGSRQKAIDTIIPDRPDLLTVAMSWAVANEDGAAARGGWERLLQVKGELPMESLAGLVQLLWKQHRFKESWEIWTRNDRLLYPNLPREVELAYNGSFERPFTGLGFDWVVASSKHRKYEIDIRNRFKGSQSLCVSFDGTENFSGTILTKRIYLPEAGRFEFQCALRLEGFTSDQGLYFRFRYTETDGTVVELGSSAKAEEDAEWQIYKHTVDIPSPEGLLEVTLSRDRSIRIDCLVGGKVWLDETLVTREESP